MQTHSLGNIIREIPIDLSVGDFTDENGFFLRPAADGVIRYCLLNNVDSEAITRTVTAQENFIDPRIYRKIFRLVTSPDTTLFAGYGV